MAATKTKTFPVEDSFYRLKNLPIERDSVYTITDEETGISYPTYNYIPMSNKTVLKCLNKLELPKKFTFLDVGCGAGHILWEVKRKYKNKVTTYGIEYQKALADIASQVAGAEQIIHADAVKYKGYGTYDVIYMYHPIVDEEMYQKLIDNIWRQMKPGAYLIQLYYPTLPYLQLDKKNLEVKCKSEFILRKNFNAWNGNEIKVWKLKTDPTICLRFGEGYKNLNKEDYILYKFPVGGLWVTSPQDYLKHGKHGIIVTANQSKSMVSILDFENKHQHDPSLLFQLSFMFYDLQEMYIKEALGIDDTAHYLKKYNYLVPDFNWKF